MSSPDISGDEAHAARTPDAQSSSLLSPPDSQRRQRNMPTPTAPTNSNGKRPLQTISNDVDDMEELAAMANGKARQEQSVKTHQKSGYQWSRNEDEPGYAWMSKKAQDEYARAWEALQHKDASIGNRYGDPFETAEKERAITASMSQR